MVDHERKVGTSGTADTICTDHPYPDFTEPRSSESNGISSQSDVFPEAESHKKADENCSRMPNRKSMPNLLPDTDYSCLLWEKTKLLKRRSVSDSLDTRTLTSIVAEDASYPNLAPRVVANEEEREDTLKKREGRLTQFFHGLEKSIWQEEQGFFDGSPEQKNFYIQANQLFIFGRTIDICPLCTRRKRNEPKSHIFPEALLKLYANIHCKGDGEFVYDLSDGKPRGAPGLSFPLFCNNCETNGSKEEGLLKDIYLEILGSESERLPISEERVHKLKHILAILIFRGILLGVNFLDNGLVNDDFYRVFFELRDYCCETDCEAYKTKEIAKHIHLSLLPNSHFNINNSDPSYILDLQLRNPEFTSIVVTKRAVFLYTKFDCFHCTLPITPTRIKSLSDSSCFASCYKGFYHFPNQGVGIQIFPQVLLDYNLSKIEKLAYHLFLLNNSAIMNCKCIIQRFKMVKWEPFPIGSKHPIQESPTDVQCLKQDEQCLKQDELIKKAKENSPFIKYQPKDCEIVCEKMLTAAEENLTHKNKKLTESIENGKALTTENIRVRKEVKKLNQQNERLELENKRLKKEIEWMKELRGDSIHTTDYMEPISN